MAIANRYLNNSDYITIQPVQLQAIIQKNQSKLLKIELAAIEEASSYLAQRFYVDGEFTNTGAWDPTQEYTAGDRVILDYPLWSNIVNYPIYTCIIYNGQAYISNQNIVVTSPSVFNPSEWILLGNQYDIFNALYPQPLFDITKNYVVGNKVYWKGDIYTASGNTQIWDSGNTQQFFYYSNIPEKNTFPGSLRDQSVKQWDNPVPYVINPYIASPSGHLPSNTTYWNYGDNRSQQMILCVMDLAIFYLHRSIAPDNIPTLVKEAYKMQIEWLTRVAKGYVTSVILKKMPQQGTIRDYGGRIKQNNSY